MRDIDMGFDYVWAILLGDEADHLWIKCPMCRQVIYKEWVTIAPRLEDLVEICNQHSSRCSLSAKAKRGS
jgi:acetyl-CoA carboxylase beta subunit